MGIDIRSVVRTIAVIVVFGCTTATKGPAVEHISPSSGSLGTTIIIRGSGFTPTDNDIAFTHPKIEFQGRHTAYVNQIASQDGTTLSLTLPDILGACAHSRLNQNEACPDIGILLPTGAVQLSVVHRHGTSNRVTFTVKEIDVTEHQIQALEHSEQVREIIRDRAPGSVLTIDFSVDEGPVTYRASGSFQVSSIPRDLVSPLKFKLVTWVPWLRKVTVETDAEGNKIVLDDYAIAKKLGANFQWKIGCRGQAPDGTHWQSFEPDAPWPGDNNDWTPWLIFVRARVEEAKEKNATPEFDICNEPDIEWQEHHNSTHHTQYLETWRRAVRLIRELNPHAVIVGPSSWDFDFVKDTFLPYAVQNNVVPDVLSWHGYELDRGSGIAAEVAQAKQYVTDRNLQVPKISINEYQRELDTYNGAVAVKYFYELERAKVASAAKGCWDEGGKTSPGYVCNLNNTLTSDRNPRSVWWAFKGYADITGRLVKVTPSPNVYGVAGYDRERREARVVLGKVSGEKAEVTIQFSNLDTVVFLAGPGDLVAAQAHRIPASGVEAATPVKTLSETYRVQNGRTTITLPSFASGDAYTIVLKPVESAEPLR